MKRKARKLENKKQEEENMKKIGENARKVLEIINQEKKKQEKNKDDGDER